MDHIFTCLHCQEPFVVHGNDFNCRILRHGAYKHNLQPIPPHATKEECDALFKSGEIYGCAKPLQIISSSTTSNGYDVIICEYI